MASAKKTAANRANARHSTGPISANGKCVAKMNAVSHGLRSVSPVIPGERAEEWEAHRAGNIASLMPVGFLENQLAERIALLTWRMHRVITYEAEMTAHRIIVANARVRGDEPPKDSFELPFSSHNPYDLSFAGLQKKLETKRKELETYIAFADLLHELSQQDDAHPLIGKYAFDLLYELSISGPDNRATIKIDEKDFLVAIGVSEDWNYWPDDWDGWNSGIIRKALEILAKKYKMSAADIVLRTERRIACDLIAQRKKLEELEAEVASAEPVLTQAMVSARCRSVLCDQESLDKIMRYESHLGRQLTQTLHLLERLQAARSGNPPCPPAAVDVTVEAG